MGSALQPKSLSFQKAMSASSDREMHLGGSTQKPSSGTATAVTLPNMEQVLKQVVQKRQLLQTKQSDDLNFNRLCNKLSRVLKKYGPARRTQALDHSLSVQIDLVIFDPSIMILQPSVTYTPQASINYTLHACVRTQYIYVQVSDPMQVSPRFQKPEREEQE